MDIINAVQQRDPSVLVEIRPDAWWMLPHPDSGLHRLARTITGHRALQAIRKIVTALSTLGTQEAGSEGSWCPSRKKCRLVYTPSSKRPAARMDAPSHLYQTVTFADEHAPGAAPFPASPLKSPVSSARRPDQYE
jgi:hypothetical protein